MLFGTICVLVFVAGLLTIVGFLVLGLDHYNNRRRF